MHKGEKDIQEISGLMVQIIEWRVDNAFKVLRILKMQEKGVVKPGIYSIEFWLETGASVITSDRQLLMILTFYSSESMF